VFENNDCVVGVSAPGGAGGTNPDDVTGTPGKNGQAGPELLLN
jgi:hypothetical protein